MRRIVAVLVVLATMGVVPGMAQAQDPDRIPAPEVGFATGGLGDCVRKDGIDYGDGCSRLKFAFGPIPVQPGANDVKLFFKTIEKPWYDGYMVRIEPNLVRADGTEPDIDDIHLHHATWLSYPEYGNGPFFAAGEEKTVAEFPHGYGMPVKATDVWYAVAMIHNNAATADSVWVTYTIDYVRKDAGAEMGMKTILPFWLDVWKNGRRASYPVYNTQRGYGQAIEDPVTLDIVRDEATGEPRTLHECTWPRDECAAFDSWREPDVGQGLPGNGKGTDIYVPQRLAGTLIGVGGHLHPGGLRVEVDAVRCTEGSPIRPGNTISSWGGLACPDADGDGTEAEEAVRVFTSDALYFDNDPTSWNFRMAVAGIPNWKVNLYEDTFLRINSVYETDISSWYEGMGIAVAYVHPGEFYGTDPFAETTTIDNRPAPECWADRAANPDLLCTRGVRSVETPPGSQNRGGGNAQPWTAPDGEFTDTVAIAGFVYAPGDLGTAEVAGVPLVKRDEPLTFWNADAFANVYHSVTGCAQPCNGATGIDYPIADFGYGRAHLGNGEVAWDSAELGYSTFFGPAMGQVPIEDKEPDEWAVDAISYSIVPGELGMEDGQTYTYYCRIHPFMRGAFKVVA